MPRAVRATNAHRGGSASHRPNSLADAAPGPRVVPPGARGGPGWRRTTAVLAGLALTFMTCVTSVVALPAVAHAAAKPPCVGPQCGVTPTPVTADSPVITSVAPPSAPRARP